MGFDEEDAKSNDSLLEPYRPVRHVDVPVDPPTMDADTRERWIMLCSIAFILGALMVAWWLYH